MLGKRTPQHSLMIHGVVVVQATPSQIASLLSPLLGDNMDCVNSLLQTLQGVQEEEARSDRSEMLLKEVAPWWCSSKVACYPIHRNLTEWAIKTKLPHEWSWKREDLLLNLEMIGGVSAECENRAYDFLSYHRYLDVLHHIGPVPPMTLLEKIRFLKETLVVYEGHEAEIHLYLSFDEWME
jgi:hypothetical protein